MSEGNSYAHIHNALKASGAVVQVNETDFRNLLARMNDGLVIEKPGGSFLSSYKYSTAYKGFIFYCKSKNQISIPSKFEKITAKFIWTPQ